MQPVGRYILLVLGFIIGLHFVLTITHEDYGRVTSLKNLTGGGINKSKPVVAVAPEAGHDVVIPISHGNIPNDPKPRRANATFVMLARNSELEYAVKSVRELEDHFNKAHNYPYVFLNDEPFSDAFKKRMSAITTGTVEYGLVPKEQWVQPDWIDDVKANASRAQMVKDNIIYGGSVSYRNMCRFNSGFFFRHELMQKYRYYWRVEPDVHFPCEVNFDPFLFMQDEKKVYGFTISMTEYEATIKTLWASTKEFITKYPQYVAKDNAMGFISENGGDTYNLCHFWSNFEIADMDFWRGEAYMAYFEHLESKGGFYYERWGDAPVHSIAAALFARKDQIHFFNEIGYEHAPYQHCPVPESKWKEGHCACNPEYNFDKDGISCLNRWQRLGV